MTDNEVKLGMRLSDGTEMNLQVGVHDWEAQCALIEDFLYNVHRSMGKTEKDLPAPGILAAVYCARNMRDNLQKMEKKIDDLIEENKEMADVLCKDPIMTIREASITDLDTDAVVNAANPDLKEGLGVCGAIFESAGRDELKNACDAIGHCDTGRAVITPGFGLKAKYIIHAVGPKWDEEDEKHVSNVLFDTYRSALELAVENGCRSIGFPLISAGYYGFPIGKAWRAAIRACTWFQRTTAYPPIEIVFAVRERSVMVKGLELLKA